MRKGLLGIATLLSAIGGLSVTSCDNIGVDICDKTEHGGEMQIRYLWPETVRNVPEKMWVIARRPTNYYRALYGWFPNGKESMEYTNQGYEIGYCTPDTVQWTPEKMQWFQKEAMPESEEVTSQRLRRGTYWMVSMNCTDWLMYEPISQFMNGDSILLSHSKVEYIQVSTPDSVGERWKNWMDTNPKYKYAADLGEVYWCRMEVDANTDEPLMIDFVPEPLYQQLDFRFNISTDHEDLHIDSVRCELSGVSCSKMLGGGYLDMDSEESVRVLFALDSTDVVQKGLDYDCTGRVGILGLCSASDVELQSGPCILRISAYTHYQPTEAEVQKLKNRTYSWSINLRNVLKSHPVTVQTRDSLQWVNSSFHEVLELPYIMGVKLEDYGNINEGIDIWPDNGNIDIEY